MHGYKVKGKDHNNLAIFFIIVMLYCFGSLFLLRILLVLILQVSKVCSLTHTSLLLVIDKFFES